MPMSTRFNIVKDYYSSLVLNNVGVTLLLDGCYHQAAECLRDALSMLQSASGREPHFTDFNERLIRAQGNLDRPRIEAESASGICVAALVNDSDLSIARYSS